jgi:hypothetical protein
MARIGISVQISSIDQYQNLFHVSQVASQELQQKILSTPWMELEFVRQEGQESWPRRRIIEQQLTWFDQWQQEISQQWSTLENALATKLHSIGTAFWIDEPGFVCGIHTDGEMPGSLQVSWIGNANLGTTFYHSKNSNHVRYQHDFYPNTGYAMINQADSFGYRHLQWHGMLTPVPVDTYRLTSYTWLNPVK